MFEGVLSAVCGLWLIGLGCLVVLIELGSLVLFDDTHLVVWLIEGCIVPSMVLCLRLYVALLWLSDDIDNLIRLS